MSENMAMKKQDEMDNIKTVEETLRRFKQRVVKNQEKAKKEIEEQAKMEEQSKKIEQDQRKDEFEDY